MDSLGCRKSSLLVEQWTFCEDGITVNGTGAPFIGGRHGEEHQQALEQDHTAAKRQCQDNAGRDGARALLQVPTRDGLPRIHGWSRREEEEWEVGETGNGCNPKPVPPTTTTITTTSTLYSCFQLMRIW